MPTSKLMQISYKDSKEGIHLSCYADTVVMLNGANNAGSIFMVSLP